MINHLSHYAIENPGTVYDEEALTALELAGRTAQKVNEVVDQVNQNESDVKEAKEYMTDNLPVFVNDRIDKMQADGTLETELVKAVASGKVDKNMPGSVTYEMLSQDAREAMTGGQTPVVGVDSVSTVNIVDKSVTENKLDLRLSEYAYFSDSMEGYSLPLVLIDIKAGTATINPKFTKAFQLISPTKRYVVNPSDLQCAYEKTTEWESCDLYLNTATKVIHIHNTHGTGDNIHPECIYLGYVGSAHHGAKNAIPVAINDVFYPVAESEAGKREFAWLNWYSGDAQSFSGKGRVAKWDRTNKCIIFPQAQHLAIMRNNGYDLITTELNEKGEYVIPYTGTGWSYIVGDVDGLSIVANSEFKLYRIGWPISRGRYVLGVFNHSSGACNFNFPCAKAKTISILGDSVSTFEGYLPEGNIAYYKGNNASVSHVHETWWGRAIDSCGLILNTNNSYSGRQVTKNATISSGVSQAGALDNGTTPDIIVVFLGYNDFRRNIPLGNYNGKGVIVENDTSFSEAYAYMLSKIQKAYPSTKLYAMTIPPCERDGDSTAPEHNENGVYLSEFNGAIRSICNALGVEVIETANCGIHSNNGSVYGGDYNSTTNDFLHPNRLGMELIARKVKQALNPDNY